MTESAPAWPAAPDAVATSESAAPSADVAVLIGRFQPVHRAHVGLLHEALRIAPHVVVVIGSAFHARTPRNPWTWRERAEMIRQALPQADRDRVHMLPVRDLYDLPRWTAVVRREVQEAAARLSAGPAARLALVGHFKEDTSAYLRGFEGWTLHRVPQLGVVDATALRDAYFEREGQPANERLAGLSALAPDSTLTMLRAWMTDPDCAEMAAEWRALRDYRAAWASAPWPPVFVTVDALVRCRDQVLLIRRAEAPGRGLLALPGGFIDVHERLLTSALRELQEETALDVPEAELLAALRQTRVFDHPDRSQRGRTITHGYYFDLGNRPLPAARAGDDAAHLEWVGIDELPALEDRFHDDHFHLLDTFLGLLETDGAQA